MTRSSARLEHSKTGIASFVLSFFPGLLSVGYLVLLTFAAQQAQERPLPDDGAGYAILGFFLTSTILLSELLALGLGVAGVTQRERRRLFAFLGIACSILVFVIAYAQNVFPLL